MAIFTTKSSNPGRARVEALLSLIMSTAQDAMKEYEQAGYSVPSPNSPHPLDSAYNMLSLKRSIRILDGACQQLCTTLAQPEHTMCNRLTMAVEPACLRIVNESHIVQILHENPNGLHIDQLSTKVSMNSEKLARVLRLLAMRGCLREVTPNVFANNRLSLSLLSTGLSSLLSLYTEDYNGGLSNLYETFVDPHHASSHEPTEAPLMYSVKDEMPNGTLWDYYTEHPQRRERFGRGMIGWSNITGSAASIKSSVWADLPAGSSVCDVGSGIGGFTIHLAKEHPHLKMTLCDLPEVVEHGRKFWTAEYPAAIEEKRVDFIPVDFFREAVKGHDVYYVRHIIHNWRDRESALILENIRKVMTPESKLLIQECVLPHVERDKDGKDISDLTTQAYHAGSNRLYDLDLTMLVVLNAKERTLHEYTKIGSQAGLRLKKHWEYGETSLMEFCIA